MLGRAVWDKLPECIFENFEIPQAKRGQFQIFEKSRGYNKHFVLKLVSFNSRQLQISERATQNSTSLLLTLNIFHISL